MRGGFFIYHRRRPGGAPSLFYECRRRRLLFAPRAAGLGAGGCRFGRRRRLVWAPKAFINHAAPAAFLIYQSSAVRPTPSGAEGAYSRVQVAIDRAFVAFLQKARSAAPHNLRFRPCLCRFFAKGTVAHDLCLAISTVPLPFFCKRHGRSRPSTADFDRAFGVFLQKARSVSPPAPRF